MSERESDLAGAGEAAAGSSAEPESSVIQEQNELLRLLKQPDLAEMVMETKRRLDAEAASGAAGGGASSAPSAGAAAGGVVATALGGAGGDAAAASSHVFWDTQPVPKLSAVVTDHGPIDAPKDVSEIKAEPYALPDGFTWCSIDVQNEASLTELYSLLAENYVEDDECSFRFNYSAPFLKWALTPPGYFPDWIVGVRTTSKGRLVACITGVPASMRAHEHPIRLCEINFLCVHKKLRAKRLAPVLIKEVTRRVNLRGIFQAAYTAGIVLPKPVASCKYWHRTLDAKKLIETGFTRLQPRMTMARTMRLYALPETPLLAGVRPLEPRDVPAACVLLNAYLLRFKLAPVYSEEEFAHALLPVPGVVDSFVIDDPAAAVPGISGLISFYHLPSTVIGNPLHKSMHAVYSYYNVPGRHGMAAVLGDALILARARGADVFNCLDLQENAPVLRDLKFGPGDGCLNYYLYNWQCPPVTSEGVGLVLL